MNDLVPIRKKKRRPEPPGSSPASRVTILLEDIQGKVQATIGAVTGFRSEIRSEIDILRNELSRRIDLLELAVRQMAADIREMREDIRGMREDVRKNTEEIRTMRDILERKADHEALLRLQARVQILEQRIGIQ